MNMYSAFLGIDEYDFGDFLNLKHKETEGWMECEKCGEVTQLSKHFEKRVKIPVFRMEDLGKVMAAGLI